MGRVVGDAFQALRDSGGGLGVGVQRLQISLAGVGVIDHGRQRLIDFVGDARGQFPQGHQPRGVRQFILMAALLHFAQFTFGHVPRHQ
ncbi:hypothetical protein D3C84_1020660 [compost metagenome]